MQRHAAEFKEVPILNYSIVNKFANQCFINGKAYPQGVGKTKKDAKTDAARIAFKMILGMGEDEQLSDDESKLIFPILYNRSSEAKKKNLKICFWCSKEPSH